jgi:hypothetical protein
MAAYEVEQVDRVSAREWVFGTRPCACGGPTRPCLYRYGLLDPPSQARVRRDVGIAAFPGRRY